MRFDADELEEQNSLDRVKYKMSKRKDRNNESNRTKHKVRAKRKRRAEISIGDSRGRRKRFLSAFGGRPSLSKQRGSHDTKSPSSSRTRK